MPTQPRVSLISRIGIARRLWLAFGLLLALLATLAGAGLLGQRSAGRDIAAATAGTQVIQLASEIEIWMANLRIDVQKYAFTGDHHYLDRIKQARAGYDALIARSKNIVATSGQAEGFAGIARRLTEFDHQLERLEAVRQNEDQILAQRLIPLGQHVATALAAQRTAAATAGSTEEMAVAAELERLWLTIQIDADRFLGFDENAAEHRVGDATGALVQRLDAARVAAGRDAKRLEAVTAVTGEAKAWLAAFKEVVSVNAELVRLRDDTLVVAGMALADDASTIVKAAQTAQDALEQRSVDNERFLAALTLLIGLLSLMVGLAAAQIIARSIVRPVNAVRAVMNDLTDGHLDVVVPFTEGADELAEMARAVARFKKIAVSAVRAEIGLHQVSAKIMMADTDNTIIFANQALVEMYSTAESDIRKAMPHFDARTLVGKNFDLFHKDPGHQRRLCGALTTTYHGSAKVGRRTFKVVANPMFGRHGERLGTVIEWQDLTDELAIEEEIRGMVESAVRGDFNRRIALDGKVGFFEAVSHGINQLAANVAGAAEELAGMLEALAKGDLSRRMARSYEGVFLRLKDDFNRTSDNLAEIVGRINEATATISAVAAEVAAGSGDLSERTEQQASSLEETAASMEQLAATVRSNADNAQQLNGFAHDARTAAERGSQVAGDAVEAMRRIEASSRKISDIIGVIDEIAFQTNLLALNAAVEAARAGDAGRGFAVVAQEVRQLAQRSAQASKEIKALIGESSSHVQDGVELVRGAGGALAEIVSAVGRVADLVHEIARATTEQANGVEEINRAVAQMDEMTQKNAALVEQSTAAARSMEDQAEALTELMVFFHGDECAPPAAMPAALAARHNSDVARSAPARVTAVKSGRTLRRANADAGDDTDWQEF
ncbi:MAG: HAMP domain-containing protein [Azospirillum sp.]|nr:HAMP domain-containing protein [Azospirillum sp.]